MLLDNVLGRNCDAHAVTALLGRLSMPRDASSAHVAVALYDVSLASGDAVAPGHDDDTSLAATLSPKPRDGAGQRWGGGAVEIAQLEALGRELVALGVRLVACQRLIHPWLQRYLRLRGVLALERLSIRHVGTPSRALPVHA